MENLHTNEEFDFEPTFEVVEEIVEERAGFMKRNKQGLIGAAIGLTIGGGAGLGAWFWERNKRLATLKQLKGMIEEIDKADIAFEEKREIPEMKYLLSNREQLQALVADQLGKTLSDKERTEWIKILTRISDIGRKLTIRDDTVVTEKRI